MLRFLSGLTVAVCLAVAPASAQNEAPPPVEAFGRLPAVADAAISPDGSKIALAMSRDGESAINVIDLAQGRSVFAISVPQDTQLTSIAWADDQRVSFVIRQTFHPGRVLPPGVRFRGAPRRVDYYRTGVANIATRDMRLLTTNEVDQWQDQGSFLIAPIEGDDGYGRMIGRANDMDEYRPAIYRMNLATGNSRAAPVRGDTGDTLGYFLDRRGAVAVRIDSNAETNRWRIFVYDEDVPRQLLEGVSATGSPVQVEGLLPDGDLVVLDEDDADEFFRLYTVARADAKRTVLFERPGFEIDGALQDPWTRDVVGVTWTEVEVKQHFFDAPLQAAYEAATTAFEGSSIVFSSWSRDRSKILVFAENGLDGGGYFLFTPATNAIRRISMAYPEVAQNASGLRQSITYRARDGTRIPAYLTIPAVAQPQNLPLVLLVHGGPHARDTMAFDYWASFLASRGYAVLQPNFRGSSGYGATWQRAGRAQWGGLMQTDVEDGVAALIRSNIADPERICIVGASYGGYAALAGATLTPDRYKCAASIAGVADLNEFLRQREIATGSESMSSDWWRISIGDRAEDRERLRSLSPANLADRVQIPILLMHGTDDTVVPIAQSERMRDRLRGAGKDVRYVVLQGDDHWLSDAATRIQMLRELETFLNQHIGEGAN